MRKRLLVLIIIVLLTGCLPEQPSNYETKTIESVMVEVKTKMAIQEIIRQTLVAQITLTERAKITTTPIPLATPTRPELEPVISNTNFYRDKFNNLFFLGLINNIGEQNISNISVEVQLLDNDGNLVGLAEGGTNAYWDIKPKHKAPFVVFFGQNFTSWNNYKIIVSNFESSGSPIYNCIEPEISNLNYGYDYTYETGEVKGVIRNNSDKVLKTTWQVFVLYDDQNRVVGVSSMTFTGILVPGQETNSEASFDSRMQPNAIVKNVEAFLCGEMR
jgi:hypothetical protein